MKAFMFIVALIVNLFMLESVQGGECYKSCPSGYVQADDCQCNPPSYGFIIDGIKDKGKGGGGWIVTYNPKIGKDFLFVHKRMEKNGSLTDLQYVVEEKGSDWVFYSGDSYNHSKGRASIGKSAPITRIKKPKGISIGKCGC